MTLGLYFFEGRLSDDSYTECQFIVCAESKAEALTLLRTSDPGWSIEDDVEDKLPVVIATDTPKGVIHRNWVHLS